MGLGGKKSSAPAKKEPVVTPQNNNVPDDAAQRGAPLREQALSAQPLLSPATDDKKKTGMLY